MKTLISIVTLLTLLMTSSSLASENDCYSTSWPHELSELEPDPELYFGRLDNGFRYILKHNIEPRDRVGVYLNVESGSLYERESERGIAHFLEHLLFNGTTHFKPGELIDYFQSIGMSFGGDVNAYTSYTDTVYKLIVPSGSTDSLDQALLVMRDYGDGALLDEEEIDRERGVILAEKTARNSAAYRSRLARTSFIMDGTLLPERQPIGIESVLNRADRELLNTFYRTWYRPDNMVLVMVGDFDIEDAEPLIEKHFASMSVSLESECPKYGRVDRHGIETFYHFEPEIGVTEVFIETVRNKEPENDSIDLLTRDLHRLMGTMIVNYRLQRLLESPDSPFTSAAYHADELFDRFQISTISARTGKDMWQETLERLDFVLEQAVRYGVLESELARVKKELITGLQNNLLGQDSEHSLQIISRILSRLDANRVTLSATQDFELYLPLIREASVGDINVSLRTNWPRGERIVQVVGDAEIDDRHGETAVKAVYARLHGRDPGPPKQQGAAVFPYLAMPDKSVAPQAVTEYADIGVRRLDFANGLIVNLKKTDFKENEIEAVLRFGPGRSSQPARGLGLLATSVINGSGTATLTASQLAEALSGTAARSWFGIGDESFAIGGSSVSSEAELLMQIIYTKLIDTGLRADEYHVAMKQIETMYRRMERDIGGAEPLYLDTFFSGGATPSGLPEWDEFRGYKLADVVDWVTPYLRGAPLELSIVGDLDVDLMTELAGKYFGSLQPRDYRPDIVTSADFPAGREYRVEIDSTIDKVLVKYGWLTDDDRDHSRSRRLHVLAAVLEERVRQLMREELGKSYSPAAYSETSRIYPGYGAIYAEVLVDRASINIARDALASIGHSFSSKPIDEEELERAREPIVADLMESIRTNGYWLHSVLSLSSRDSRQLEWPLTLISDFDSVTSDQLNDLARSYLQDSRRGVGIAVTH